MNLPPSVDLAVPGSAASTPQDVLDELENRFETALAQNMATAVLYLRVSTKEQAQMGGEAEGFSIPAQRETGIRKAESLGAAVVAEFVERGESAKTAERPELQRLLKFVAEHHVTYVIVHKVDRLARNRADDVTINLALKQAGATLVSVTENIDETPSGLLLHGIMSSIAEFYSRNLATEVIKGSTQKAKNGGTVGKAPIGYLNVRKIENGREARTVEIDPVRGPLVRWGLEQYATGQWTIRSLQAELTARGLRSVPGPQKPSNVLSRSRVHRMLHNPYYKGLVTYRGATYVGNHEPLVSRETWNQVQAVLEAQGHAGEKQRKHHHYLKGSVFCGQCSSRLIVTNAKNRHGTVYPYFVCIGRHQKRTTCTQQAMPIDWVEAKVEEHYAAIRLTPERAESLRQYVHDGLSERRADAELERKQQVSRVKQVNDEQKKLLQAHYANAIPLGLLKEEQDRIAHELEAAERRLEAAAKVFVDIETSLNKALQLAQDCQLAYRLAGNKLRRQFNQAFFEQLLIDDEGNVRSELAEPFALLLGEALAAEAKATLVTAADQSATTVEAPAAETTEARAPWRETGFWDGNEPHGDGSGRAGLKERLLVPAVGFEPTLSGT